MDQPKSEQSKNGNTNVKNKNKTDGMHNTPFFRKQQNNSEKKLSDRIHNKKNNFGMVGLPKNLNLGKSSLSSSTINSKSSSSMFGSNSSASEGVQNFLKGLLSQSTIGSKILKTKLLFGILTACCFLLIFLIVAYFVLNPLVALRTFIFKDPSVANIGETKEKSGWDKFWGGISCFFNADSCSLETQEKKIYKTIVEKKDKLAEKNLLNKNDKINPYLAMATSFYSSSYDVQNGLNGDETNSNNVKMFNEATRMTDVILTEGEGLTKKVWACINADDSTGTYYMCGDKGENQSDCSTTCTKNVAQKGDTSYYKEEQAVVPRTDDEFKAWLIKSGELEKHLSALGVQLPTNEEDKNDALNSAADSLILAKNTYAQLYENASSTSLSKQVFDNIQYQEGQFRGFIGVIQNGAVHASIGCGLASSATIADSFLGTKSYTTDSVYDLYPSKCGSGGCYGYDIATSLSNSLGIKYEPEVHYSRNVSAMNSAMNHLQEMLASGDAIAIMRIDPGVESDFSYGGGHFIILYGVTSEGDVWVWNPNEKNTGKWPFDWVLSKGSDFQIFYR